MLIKKMEWLTNQLTIRGAKIGGITEKSAAVAVRNAISLLGDIVV